MQNLRNTLTHFTEATCRLLLGGWITLDQAMQHTLSPFPCEEYVDAIVSEVEEMPDDLRQLFLSSEITLRVVRRRLIDRLVESGQFNAETGTYLHNCSVDLASIRAHGLSEHHTDIS